MDGQTDLLSHIADRMTNSVVQKINNICALLQLGSAATCNWQCWSVGSCFSAVKF